MNPKLIEQMRRLYKFVARKSLRWCVLVSGVENRIDMDKCTALLPKGTLIRFIDNSLSASEARSHIIGYLSNVANNNRYDYYMNIDSDDELINPHKLVSLIKHPKLDSDLLSFGLELSENSKLPKMFQMSEEVLKTHRRYITEELQCMFLFIHSRKVLMDIWVNSWMTPLPKSDPNESLEDLRLAIRVAEAEKYKISTICVNFIRYIEHPNQVSNKQESGELEKLHIELKGTKQLYANHKHYKYKYNNLIEWNPYGK